MVEIEEEDGDLGCWKQAETKREEMNLPLFCEFEFLIELVKQTERS